MAASIRFYELLGLKVQPTDPDWESHHRTVDGTGDVDIDLDSSAFAAAWSQGWPAGRTGVVLGFRVSSRDAVDAAYERLVGAGHVSQQPPYDAFWGARYAIVSDPDGNAVGIMSLADPARRTPPPAAPSSR